VLASQVAIGRPGEVHSCSAEWRGPPSATSEAAPLKRLGAVVAHGTSSSSVRWR
jgi:hypothetical protein